MVRAAFILYTPVSSVELEARVFTSTLCARVATSMAGYTPEADGPRPSVHSRPYCHVYTPHRTRQTGKEARRRAQLLNRSQEREWERFRLRGRGAALVCTRPRLVNTCEPLLSRASLSPHDHDGRRVRASVGPGRMSTTGMQMPCSTAVNRDRLGAKVPKDKRCRVEKRPRPPIREDAAYAFVRSEVSQCCGQRRFRSVAISTRRFRA
jgi:hypothetical protein